MTQWRPINEIGRSESELVAVAGPRGIYLQERRIALMTQHNWLLFHELAPLPKVMQYILSEDDYEVHHDIPNEAETAE